MNKKTLAVLGVVVGVPLALVAAAALFVFPWVTGTYNTMVDAREGVKSKWSQVENVYQRRADLIPNLVATAKGYAKHEKETLTAVIQARAEATKVSVDVSSALKNGAMLSPAMVQQFQQAQGELSSALGRLMVVMEKYPDLKADQLFLNLQAEIAGTENRISVERRNFNETAQVYNSLVKRFPNNLIAGYFKFQEYPYFEAKKGSDVAPKVEF